jgi:hypothetical protein
VRLFGTSVDPTEARNATVQLNRMLAFLDDGLLPNVEIARQLAFASEKVRSKGLLPTPDVAEVEAGPSRRSSDHRRCVTSDRLGSAFALTTGHGDSP